jgi:hypothetical protein
VVGGNWNVVFVRSSGDLLFLILQFLKLEILVLNGTIFGGAYNTRIVHNCPTGELCTMQFDVGFIYFFDQIFCFRQ